MNPVGAAAMVATSAGASINSPQSTTASQQYASNSKCSHTRSQPTTQNISGPSFSHHHDHQRSFEDSPHQHHVSTAVNTGIVPDSTEMSTAHSGGKSFHFTSALQCGSAEAMCKMGPRTERPDMPQTKFCEFAQVIVQGFHFICSK